jgi:glycosyltransferase involved in cell wall biosynthesis
MLQRLLPPLLHDHPQRVALLVGRGGERFAQTLIEECPQLQGRIVATGGLAPLEAANHLAACDLLLQPYADGVTARRSSLMAGLALGKPIVTTTGALSESYWLESGAVALAPADAPGEIIAQVERVWADAPARAALGARAKTMYDSTFALTHTIEALRAAADESEKEVGK